MHSVLEPGLFLYVIWTWVFWFKSHLDIGYGLKWMGLLNFFGSWFKKGNPRLFGHGPLAILFKCFVIGNFEKVILSG